MVLRKVKKNNAPRYLTGHAKSELVPDALWRLKPLTVALCLCGAGSASVQAKDYFDPSFLGDAGTQVDLSAYESAGSTPEGSYLIDIYMNQLMSTTRQVRFVKDDKGDKGEVVPELTPEMLRGMGVALDRIPAFKGLPDDKPVGDLKKLIPDATVTFNMSKLRLDLTVPQVDMDAAIAGQVDPKLWDEGVPAAMFSYNMSGSRNWMDGSNGSPSSTSQNLFGSANGGLNLGPWRLRTSGTVSQSQNDSGSNHYSQTDSQLNDTYVQRDVQRLKGYLTMGESSSGGAIFDSIPFRGASLISTDDMTPNSQRGFAPVITGTAKSNARVTVEQNGNVIYETNVPPGPFSLTDIYNAGNGGDLVVTVTEADGSKHVSSQAYSSLPVMKRPGAVDYEVTAGRYHNGGYTTGSDDPLFAMVTTTVGLPHYLTVYGGLLGASNYQSLALGLGVSLGIMGAVSLDATYARTKMQDGSARDDHTDQGESFRARYSKSMMTTGTTVDLSAYRYSTREYHSFQDAMSQGHSLQDGYAPWLAESQRSSWQVSLSQALGALGSAFLRASRNDYWGSGRVVNSVSAGFSSSVKGVGYSINYDVDHTTTKDNKDKEDWPTNRQVSLNVNVPFSIFSPSSSTVQDISSNYSVSHDNHGRTSQQAGLSGSMLDSRLSWGASGSTDNQGGGQSGNLNLGWQGSKGSVGMSYGVSSNTKTLSGNASGGVIVHPHGISLTPTLGDTVALIEAPGAGGVTVMNGRSVTDSRGYAVAPGMQTYQRNVISLDPTTLPDGVDVTGNSVAVYPTRGAVVEAKFKTRVGRQAMLTLTFQGKPVPFGAMAVLPQDEEQNSAIVGDGGMVYLTGAPVQGVLTVQWGDETDQQCRVSYDLGPLPEASKDKNAPPVSTIVQQTLTCEPVPGGAKHPVSRIADAPTDAPATTPEKAAETTSATSTTSAAPTPDAPQGGTVPQPPVLPQARSAMADTPVARVSDAPGQ